MVALLGCAVLLVAAVLYARNWSSNVWRDLERAEDRFGTPDGFTKVGSERAGTTFCVISCDEARITIAFTAEISEDQVCEALMPAAAPLSRAAEKETIDGTCFVSGRMDGELAGTGDANLTGFVEGADEIAAVPDYEPGWISDGARRAHGGQVMTIYLNSGLD